MNLDNIQKKGTRKIEEIFTDYAIKRKQFNQNFVGQFLDEEGVKDHQFGIYGMSVFLSVTSSSYDTRVVSLHNECIGKFKIWIDESRKYNLSNKQKDANDKSDSDTSSIYELRNIIPKICFAYEACRKVSDLYHEKSILSKYLDEAQFSNGSFGFLCTDKDINGRENLITTALVLRSYLRDHSSSDATRRAVQYLKQHVNSLNNIFEQLYVFNAIQIIVSKTPTLAQDGFSNFHENILKCLKKIFHEVSLNPTSFTNPINIDFNDYGRTRYYRLYSDLILIESLALGHPSNLNYLRGSVGERTLKKVWECIDSNKNKDTTLHRASFGFYYNLSQILKIVGQKYENEPGLIGKFYGWWLRVNLFGIDINKEMFIIIWSTPFVVTLLAINIYFSIPSVINTIVSFLLARFANILGLAYDNKRKNKI